MNSSIIQTDIVETTDEKNQWKTLINEAIKKNQSRDCTCPYYYQEIISENINKNEKCSCDHPINEHDLKNTFILQNYKRNNSQKYTYAKMSLNNCGTLKNNSRVCTNLI